MKKNFGKIVLLLLMLLAIFSYFYFSPGQYLTLEKIKQQQDLIINFYLAHKILTIVSYFAIYVVSTALSIPGATVLTLLGAAVFGLTTGTIIISFASTIGASLAFLGTRFLFRDYVQERFQKHLLTINKGIREKGGLYLFSLRLIPIFPFFLVNLLMGLTSISLTRFFIISQLGMLPLTLVYVFTGTQLAEITSLKDILSLNILIALSLISLFPLTTKKIMDAFKKERSLN